MTAPLLVALAALALAPTGRAQGQPDEAAPQRAGGSGGRLRPPATTARSPVRVDADEVQYAFQKREVTFSGKRPVTLTRDDATLSCRKIVAHTDEAGQIVTAACTGDVRFSRGLRVVTCEQATFENATDRVVCVGNPVLRDGGSEAHGTRLVYDLRSDEAKLEGAVITLPGVEIEQKQRELEQRRKERRK